MHLWQIFCIVGIAFLILEMFTPSLFFLNFALAAIICAPISVLIKNPYALTIMFFVLSFISFAFLRPIILRKFDKSTETGIRSKYIGQIVKTSSEISALSGVISIYGERWEARSNDGSTIPPNTNVKIVRNESLIMYVEKIQ